MRIPRPLISVSVVALATLSDLSFAQNLAPPPDVPNPTGARTAVYDPQQFPSIRGEIERLSLTARGDIDGVILKDGTEVKTSPDLSTQIAFAIKPGDRVTIHGLRAAALPLVRAVSITDDVTHRTVTDSDVSTSLNPLPPRPAPPPRGAPPPALAASSETLGRVRMALHGPQGEVNGVLLESGVILRFPPDQTDQLGSLIQPRQSLVAEGITVTNSLGTVVDVQQLGPSHDRLVAVGPPMPPMDDRGPAGPRRRPPPLQGGPQGTPPPPPAGPPPVPGVLPLPPSPPPAG
jgi:hypothetical protein